MRRETGLDLFNFACSFSMRKKIKLFQRTFTTGMEDNIQTAADRIFQSNIFFTISFDVEFDV